MNFERIFILKVNGISSLLKGKFLFYINNEFTMITKNDFMHQIDMYQQVKIDT